MLEDQFLNILLAPRHFALLAMVISIIYLLKVANYKRVTVGKWLFNGHKWLVTPINIALSFFGIFVLGLTSCDTTGMKVAMATIISATLVLCYEAVIKHFERAVKRRFFDSENEDNDDEVLT